MTPARFHPRVPAPSPAPGVPRREFLACLATAGAAGGLFPGVLWARLHQDPELTVEMIEEAEKVAGLEFTDEQREMMLEGLTGHRQAYRDLRGVDLPNEVPPAFHFDPAALGPEPPTGPTVVRPSAPSRLPDPGSPADLAFATVGELGALLRSGRLTSLALTELCLERLERFGEELECVVTLMPERALERARAADRELAEGRDRGPLHGIPWGAKDLLATAGVRTTWGAPPFADQVLGFDATVVRRLNEAGAVLVAKLTLGSLALGDVWFGGRTRNPWNPEQGSSGSSAGSAAAVTAGLVPFAIGSETLGSIVSPASRCGTTALRPTFGRVSRHGAMALSWTMDKLGPMTRCAEDCALVLAAIQGPDGRDASVRAASFEWDPARGIDGLRVGVLEEAFEGEGEDRELDRAALAAVRALGIRTRPVALPDDLPIGAMRIILNAEAAAAFDALTRSEQDALLVRQGPGGWPNTFRTARLIPAVEYIQANRARTLLLGAMAEALEEVDVVVSPSFARNLLLATNLSGHPVAVAPSGFREDGTPSSVSFLGGLWKDADALRLARAFQDATGHHLRRPPGFT